MSPGEITEAITSLYNSSYTAVALFLTVLSGYMVVAYTVGQELKSPQLIFINMMFVAFSLVFATGAYSWALAAVEFANTYGGGAGQFAKLSTPIGLMILYSTILGALLFMRDIRARK